VSYSTLSWEDVEKISEISTAWIARYELLNSQTFFFCLVKKRATALHKLTFVWKNVQNGGASLDSFFKSSWPHAWKISDHLKLQNIQKKNSK